MKNELKYKSISDFSVKEEENQDLIIAGWGAKYNNIDSYKDVLMPGCAKKTLSERADRIAFCEQHDMRNPIGKFLVLEERNEGIWFEVKVSNAEPKIKTKIREGILKEFSIGYSEIEATMGKHEGKDVNLVKEIKLYEISVVTVAANDQATLQEIKAEEVDMIEKAYDTLIGKEKKETTKYELLRLKKKALEAIRPESKPPKEPEPQKSTHIINIKF